MSMDARFIRVEEKIDRLSDQLREYHEELLRNYYTKADVDARLKPLPEMLRQIDKLKNASRRHNDAMWLQGEKSNVKDWMGKNWTTTLNIVLFLILIIASLLDIKLPTP